MYSLWNNRGGVPPQENAKTYHVLGARGLQNERRHAPTNTTNPYQLHAQPVFFLFFFYSLWNKEGYHPNERQNLSRILVHVQPAEQGGVPPQ